VGLGFWRLFSGRGLAMWTCTLSHTLTPANVVGCTHGPSRACDELLVSRCRLVSRELGDLYEGTNGVQSAVALDCGWAGRPRIK
jgi:hypothetical protein